jgi:hypothetical protein
MNLFPNKLSETNEMSLKKHPTTQPKEKASLETKYRRVAISIYKICVEGNEAIIHR